MSIIDPAVWKDVYGHRTTSSFQKLKTFYGPDPYGDPPGLIRAENVSHGQQRRLVAHAFSDKALREQEAILKGYAKLLVEQVTKASKEQGEVDLVRFYNYTTFDIMADLTFGEPLGLLKEANYVPWVKAFFGNVKALTLIGVVKRWPMLDGILQKFIPKELKEQKKQHIRFSAERVDKRMQRKTDRPDSKFLIFSQEQGIDQG